MGRVLRVAAATATATATLMVMVTTMITAMTPHRAMQVRVG